MVGFNYNISMNIMFLNEIKFFYDNYTDNDVGGMFGMPHVISVFLFIALGILALRLTRNFDKERVRGLHLIVAILITAMEVCKISLRIYKGQSYDSWVPLYFCSLFIFALWLSLLKNEHLCRMGYAYMTMGGIVASVGFTLYPSTSFGMYPWWHPSVAYSFIFHFAMFVLGVLALTKGVYKPRKQDGLLYFIFIISACIPSVFINNSVNTNCMFLRHPFKLPLLQELVDFSPVLYIAVMALLQSVAIFWGCFGIYSFIKTKMEKKRENK